MIKISIITTVRNGEATIQKCIESVQSQTIPVEHIIVDGASMDSTLNILEKYKSGISKIISEKDDGIYEGMNKGLKLATGDVIGILNADDIYANNEILETIRGLFTQTSADTCYGDLMVVNSHESKKIIRFWKSTSYHPNRFYWGWMPPHPTFFVRRRIYEQYGVFNPEFGSAADYELMLRFLLKYQISSVYLPEIITIMQKGGISNHKVANRIKANRNDLLAWKKNGLTPYPWTLISKPLRKVLQFITPLYLGEKIIRDKKGIQTK